MLEDFLGVREAGIESASEGDLGEREGSERSVGFDEVGMELFELERGAEAVEKMGRQAL